MSKNFNSISLFVAKTVLCHEEQKERVRALKHWLRILKHLRTASALNSMMAIVAALNSPHLFRLTEDMAQITGGSKISFEAASKICAPESGWAAARRFMRDAKAPSMPYLGIYLTDVR